MPIESYQSLFNRMVAQAKDFCSKNPGFKDITDTPEYKAGFDRMYANMVHNDNLFK